MNQIIPNSFDDFVREEAAKDDNIEQESKEKDLHQKFEEERLEWTNKIKEMSQRLKKVFEINELMTEIYTERQRAVEYHHYLISLFIKINKVYKQKYSKQYDYYTFTSQKRFPNDRNKEIQILSDLSNIVEKKEILNSHIKFIEKTIGTLDNMIFGIKHRIEIEQISRGK